MTDLQLLKDVCKNISDDVDNVSLAFELARTIEGNVAEVDECVKIISEHSNKMIAKTAVRNVSVANQW